MKTEKIPKINLTEIQASIAKQFSGLNPNDPSQWPAIPKYLFMFGIVCGTVALLWFTWLSAISDELDVERVQESELREIYKGKLAQSINLDELKKQYEQVKQYVNQLEKQLPSKAEMDALLSDINQAGIGRSLQFELFKPGQVVVRDYYAELPISIKVTGAYHDVAMFASDIAHLSRIVTLNDLSLAPMKDRGSILVMQGVAKTFRYLDSAEVNAQKAALISKGDVK